MCMKPGVLCLDEPAAGLRPRESGALNHLQRSITAEGGSILLIEPDNGVVMRISDRMVVFDYSCTIAGGRPAQVRDHPKVDRRLSWRRGGGAGGGRGTASGVRNGRVEEVSRRRAAGAAGGRLCEQALPAILDRLDDHPNGERPGCGAQRLIVHPPARYRAPGSGLRLQVRRA